MAESSVLVLGLVSACDLSVGKACYLAVLSLLKRLQLAVLRATAVVGTCLKSCLNSID